MSLTQEQTFMWENAVLLFRKYAWHDALSVFAHLAEIIRDQDEVTKCRINQGLIHARLGNYKAAQSTFSTMPRCSSNSILACCTLAEIGLCAGDASEALAWYCLCRDHLIDCDDRAEFDRFDFKLTIQMIEENISTLRSARVKSPEDVRFLNMHRLPADCIFSSNLSIQDLYIAIDRSVPFDTAPSRTNTESLLSTNASQGGRRVLQWLNSSSARPEPQATRLSMDSASKSIMPLKMREKNAKLIARDAKVTYSSTRHLADFIRNEGQGDERDTCRSPDGRMREPDSRQPSSIYSRPADYLSRTRTEPVLESVTEHIAFGSNESLMEERIVPYSAPATVTAFALRRFSSLPAMRSRLSRPSGREDDEASSMEVAPSLDIIWPSRLQWRKHELLD